MSRSVTLAITALDDWLMVPGAFCPKFSTGGVAMSEKDDFCGTLISEGIKKDRFAKGELWHPQNLVCLNTMQLLSGEGSARARRQWYCSRELGFGPQAPTCKY